MLKTSSCPAQVPAGPPPPEHRDDPPQPGLVGGPGRRGASGHRHQHPRAGQGRALHDLLLHGVHHDPPSLPQRGSVGKRAGVFSGRRQCTMG